MEKELDLRKILKALLNKWWLIGILALIGCVAGFGSSYIVNSGSQYQATISMYVYNDMFVYNDNASDADLITATDISESIDLVETYIVVLTSNAVLDKVVDSLEIEYTTKELRNKITVELIDDLSVFDVIVTDFDQSTAALIANKIAEIAPEEVSRIVNAGSIEVISFNQSSSSNASDPKQNMLLGLMLGMFIAILIILAMALFDNKIRTKEDLTTISDIPVLGEIPSMSKKK